MLGPIQPTSDSGKKLTYDVPPREWAKHGSTWDSFMLDQQPDTDLQNITISWVRRMI
jgi:hypothetical protein